MPPIERIADMSVIAKLAIFFQEERKRHDVTAALLVLAAASLEDSDLTDLVKVLKEFSISHGCKGELQKINVKTGEEEKPSEPIMPEPTIKLGPDDYSPDELQRN